MAFKRIIREPIVFLLQKTRFFIEKLGYNISPIDKNLHADLDLLLSKCDQVGAIFDIGANIGKFSDNLSKRHRQKDFYLFEAIPELADRLVKDIPFAKIENAAVSDLDGSLSFNICKKSDVSSLFSPNRASIPSSYLNIMEVSETITVPSVTIDQYCGSNSIEHINLMKIDVQGAEHRVLRGSAGMLRAQRVDIVLAEAFMLPFYDDAPLFDELIALMASFGYRVHGIYEPIISGRSGRIQWADFIFVSPRLEAVSRELKRRSLGG